MDNSKIEMFIMSNGKNFATEKLPVIKSALEKVSDDKSMYVQSLNLKDNTTTIILGILLGADRIYLGQVGLGIFKIFTMLLGIGVIWWFIDLFTMSKRTKEYNFNQFMSVASMS